MSQSCDRIRENFSAYIDGMLSEKEAKEMESHLKECEACREFFAFFSAMIKSVGALPEVSASENFRSNLHEKLLKEKETKGKKLYPRPLWQLASGFVAAAAVIVISVVSFSKLPEQSELTPVVPTPVLTQSEKTEENKLPAGAEETMTPSIQNEISPKNATQNKKETLVLEDKKPSATPVTEVEKPLIKQEEARQEQGTESETVHQPMIEQAEAVALETAEIVAATADVAVSGGVGMARAAMPFIKTGMHYYVQEESYEKALALLSGYEQEGDGYLVPDEALASLCEQLETLEGYTGHKNTAENLMEPTDEQVALYSTHTCVVVTKSE